MGTARIRDLSQIVREVKFASETAFRQKYTVAVAELVNGSKIKSERLDEESKQHLEYLELLKADHAQPIKSFTLTEEISDRTGNVYISFRLEFVDGIVARFMPIGNSNNIINYVWKKHERTNKAK
ncbi:MAG: hypothetical protein FWB72_05255 [Firmicutes bacterium]|nr:hypothetical protein [Bacillota bacterium]